MNLIVSDFDGTFYDDNYLKNIEFIKSLSDNYDFVIATGRSYNFLKEDLRIKCKYYICNDGGYIIDENENIIYKNYMNNSDVKIIYERIKELDYKNYFFDYIEYLDTNIKENLNKISIRKRDEKASEDLKYFLKDLTYTYGYLSERTINILSNDSKKEKAIERIIKLNNYDKIYVIGNEVNDYNMIKKYDGYLISRKVNKKYKTISNFLELKKEL